MAVWLAILHLCAHASDAPRSGTFQVDEHWEDVQTRHEVAVDEAVQRLPILLRPLVRPALTRSVWSCDAWRIQLAAHTIVLQCRGRPPLPLPADGSEVDLQLPDGRWVTLAGAAEADRIVVDASSRHGSQQSTWLFDDPDHMTVTRRLRSRWLRQDVTWTVRYRQVD